MKTVLRSPYPIIGRIPAPNRPPRHETHYMKSALTACVLGAMMASLLPVSAQTPPPAPQIAPVKLTQQELTQLLAPIALYPDALIALILPASTVPSDVVMGARYVAGNGDTSAVDYQPWDDSVKSLTRYPDVLSWMDQNLDWTASVGEAFVNQPADVMNAVQALRAQAKAAGSLIDTPQQKVVVEEEYIRIIPADPEIIYVPQYDPQIVYVESYTPSIITFGVGFAVGSWLNYDFDWRRRCVYRGNWRGWNNNNWNNNWRGGGGNTVNVVNIDVNNVTPWQASANSQRQITQRQRNNNGNARIANARSEQPRNNVAGNLPAGGTFNPNAATAVPRPSRLNVDNQRANRTERPNRPENGSVAANQNQNPRSLAGGNRPEQRQRPPSTPVPQAATTPPSNPVAAQGERSEPRRNRDVTQTPPSGNTPIGTPENNRPGRERPATPSTPPNVAGQLGQPAQSRRDGQFGGFNPQNRQSGQNSENARRSGQPGSAPQIQRPSSSVERPAQPRENPQAQTSRPPQFQQRPQQNESRPRQQQAPRQQEQARPPQQEAPRQMQPQQQQTPRQQPQMQRQERPQQSAPPQQRQERPSMPQRPSPESRMQAPQQSAPPQSPRGSGDGQGRRGQRD